MAPASQRPKPIVNLSTKPPAPAPAVAAKPAKKKDATLPIAGGALAFLALGGAAAAMTRRRHDHEEEWIDEEPTSAGSSELGAADETIIHEEQPAIVAPAAFDLDRGEDSRREGETHVDRAYRGPTPDNPSVSLKNRLRRAAFMDKREREVAAGRAVPVHPMAGLPERTAEEQQEQRELDRV